MAKGKSKNPSMRAYQLAVERYAIAQDQDGRPVAIPKQGPNIVLHIGRRQPSLSGAVRRGYQEKYKSVIGGTSLQNAMDQISADAEEAPKQEISFRVGQHNESIVIDLGRQDGQVVIITPGSGSEVKPRSPIPFRRTNRAGELPIPVDRMSYEDLRNRFRHFLHVPSQIADLILAWAVSVYFPEIDHFLLSFVGPPGSGKTFAASFLTRLIDAQDEPKTLRNDEEDFVLTIAGSFIPCLDNLSTVQRWQSDMLSRMVTGGVYETRTLYTNEDLTTINYKRAGILTSVGLTGIRDDLADRLLSLILTSFENDDNRERRDKTQLNGELAQLLPAMAGALYRLVSETRKILPDMRTDDLPRMGSSYRIFLAVDAVLGTHTADTYDVEVRKLAWTLLENDQVSRTIFDIAKGSSQEVFTADLLVRMESMVPPGVRESYFPKSASALVNRLNMAQPTLRRIGIDVRIYAHEGGGRPSRVNLRDTDQRRCQEIAEAVENRVGDNDARLPGRRESESPTTTLVFRCDACDAVNQTHGSDIRGQEHLKTGKKPSGCNGTWKLDFDETGKVNA